MNIQKLFADIKQQRIELMKKDMNIEPPKKISITRGVFDKIVKYSNDVYCVCPKDGEQPGFALFGMEIEIIEPAEEGYFSVGGIMKGVN